MTDKKINKKAIIIVSIAIITVLLIGSLIFLINKIPLVSAAGTCSGSANACYEFDFEREGPPCSGCIRQDGCSWAGGEFGLCSGVAFQCNTYSTEGNCNMQCGCTWIPGINTQINIGDAWKDVDTIYINIGDVWKTGANVYINIGDVWKTVY